MDRSLSGWHLEVNYDHHSTPAHLRRAFRRLHPEAPPDSVLQQPLELGMLEDLAGVAVGENANSTFAVLLDPPRNVVCHLRDTSGQNSDLVFVTRRDVLFVLYLELLDSLRHRVSAVHHLDSEPFVRP